MEPIKTIEIQDIFKIPIYKTELSLDTDELEKACNQYKDNNKSRAISNVGGYQSNNLNLGNEYIFESLMDEIEEHTSNFAKYFINDNKQGVTNIWININGYKDYNKPHNHVNSEISGVYYVKAPEKSGNITFEHPAKNVLSYYN